VRSVMGAPQRIEKKEDGTGGSPIWFYGDFAQEYPSLKGVSASVSDGLNRWATAFRAFFSNSAAGIRNT